MKGHIYLWKENSSYDKKFLPETRNFFFCDKNFLPATRNFFLWEEISASDKRFLSVKINFFLWQSITYSAKKFLPVTRKYFLHVVCDRKNSFIWQEIRTLKSNLCQNSVNCWQISWESEDFVGAWLPGSRLISHPDPEPPPRLKNPVWILFVYFLCYFVHQPIIKLSAMWLKL